MRFSRLLKTVASFLLLQQCKNGVCSHFCFSNYLTSSLDREGAPGGPAGFTYRQGRGRLPLLHSRGVWGERASVPPGKGRPANGACFAEVISLESRGGMTGANSVASFQKRHSRRSFNNRQMRPRRATAQIGKSRRNGEPAMCVVRNRASQGARSRWIFVFPEIYPRVAPIWVSALPWMVCFTLIFELKNAAERPGVRWRQRRRQWQWGRRLSRGGSPGSCTEYSNGAQRNSSS